MDFVQLLLRSGTSDELLDHDRHSMSTEALLSVEKFLCNALSLIRNSFNSMLPVNRLAPEILADIFERLIGPAYIKEEGLDVFRWPSSSLRYPLPLKDISCVCQQWREICVDTGTLWTDILDPDFLHAVPMFVERSKSAPLHVSVSPATRGPFIDSLFQLHGSCIKELHLMFRHKFGHYTGRWRPPTWEDVSHCVDYPAPALEELRLHAVLLYYSTNRSDGSSTPRILFRGVTPRLKSLIISSNDWLPRNHFGSLIRLCLDGYDRRTWTLIEMVTFLLGCPSLEEVIIHSLYRRPYEEYQHSDDTLPSVVWPYLCRLVIGRMEPSLASWILRHITIPECVALRIFSVFRQSDGGEDAGNVGDVLNSLFLLDYPVVMQLCASSGMPLVALADATRGIRLDSILPTPLDVTQVWMHQLWTTLPLSKITKLLLIETSDRLEVDTLFEFLTSLSTLVYSQGYKLGHLEYPEHERVHVLTRFLALLTPTDQNNISCPSLSTLDIHTPCSPNMLDTILEFAQRRARLGYPLQKLIIELEAGASNSSHDWTSLASCVEGFEIRPGGGPPPTLDWPAVCGGPTHELWPAW
ncbi:hypothetical protein SCP_1800160 [Sparassis crispa]|uniref:F-box domain-containing protein n=1 Tax=Sparassis crispa TaxID=139825 RepID=A0A401H6E5_9APHY|nr:hypothetical protein SCP_1800160 [Sparassis crispa]GBE89994.1 hypothetical protein SCP_1800160 [Sparassis crispa]